MFPLRCLTLLHRREAATPMTIAIDYFFAPNSPWAYLGHQRFADIARQHGARVNVLPVDLGGRVFPLTGGLPLAKRAPQRQAYRLLELKRFSDWLQVPLNPNPSYFPVNPDDAAKLIIAVDLHDGTDAAMALAGAVMRAVWVEERHIADEATLAALLQAQGLNAARLDDAHTQRVHQRYEEDSQRAIDAGVFGAPSYVIDGEIFWGQDRLDFVERRLQHIDQEGERH
jgi:carboxymethylenebutenolidase